MVVAAREQLLERRRAEAERSGQAHQLLAEHYPGLARFGRPMAERGMRLTWQLTQLGLVLVGLGVALSAFGMLGLGAWATGTGLAVALVVIAMTVVGVRFGSPYDQLHRAVTQVIGRRGVEAAETLLAAYPKPDAAEISDVALELTLVPPGE